MAHKDKLKTYGIDTSHIKRENKPRCNNCKFKEKCSSKNENMIFCLRHKYEEEK